MPPVSVDQPAQVRGLEVRDSDRADSSVGLQGEQRLPGLDIAVAGRKRPVDEVEVHVVEPERRPALPRRRPVPGRSRARCCSAWWSGRSPRGRGRRRRVPRRHPARSGTSPRCRSSGSRPRSAAVTARSVSAGGTWKTPKPELRIRSPLFRVTEGWSVIAEPFVSVLPEVVLVSAESIPARYLREDRRYPRSLRVRLVIARCSVDYVGRLTAHLPMATRLLHGQGRRVGARCTPTAGRTSR